MSEPAGPRAVVVGHGAYAAGLVDAVGRISGKAGQLRAVTNEGRDGPGIEHAIRAALAEIGATVIFTDLQAGSCTIAARRVAHGDPTITVVTGASVPLVLAYVMGPAATPADIEQAIARGRDAVALCVAGKASSGR